MFIFLLPYALVIVLLLNLLLLIFIKTLDCLLCGFARIFFQIPIHPPSWVAHLYFEGVVKLLKIHTDDNLADMLTKAIPTAKLVYCMNSAGICRL